MKESAAERRNDGRAMQGRPRERVCFEARRHGVVLARPFVRSFLIAGVGGVVLVLPWPLPVVGPVFVAAGAIMALAAVWRWDRTRLVVTTERVALVQGVAQRRAAGVRLTRVAHVEVRQSALGRLLGYGTLTAGALEVDYVPRPGQVARLIS